VAAPGRLKRRAAFLLLAAKGRKAPMPGLVLQAMQRGDAGPARLGFTVTKRVGNAVVRNRVRRRLKEAARLNLAEQPLAGVDLVLIGREGTRRRAFGALREDFRRALAKVGASEVNNAAVNNGPVRNGPVSNGRAGDGAAGMPKVDVS
jgi:ribonuclease P protein component